MTITASLSNALSGLTATARAAELVSSNVANSMTDGYGARELELSARSLGRTGSGVRVDGVNRNVDEHLLSDRRGADATLGYDRTVADFQSTLERAIGIPGDAGSLSDRQAVLEAALIEASSRPDSDARLSAVFSASTGLATHLNRVSDTIQTARMDADREIGAQVGRLNEGLIKVQNLNREIQEARARGADPSSLYDLRQRALDDIAPIVPVRQVPRANGAVALFTTGGAVLLEGLAAEIGFSPRGVIVPEMTQASGALSGLTINGVSVNTSGTRSPFSGGSLDGLLKIRDELATHAQAQLDGVARDLVERFQDPALDATRAVGAPGLFTDGGTFFDVTDELGLSSRVSVTTEIDPAAGGALWRLRDGLGATAPGDVGRSTLLRDLTAALTDLRAPVSGGFVGTARSAAGLAAEFLSSVSAARLNAESDLGYSAAKRDSLKMMELDRGVDTDHEMQKLMLIEQAYAANARVMSTADELIKILIGL